MAAYFVTRHAGAVEWARRKGIDAELVAHFDVRCVCDGDLVLGPLPVHLVAEVNDRGGHYFHIEMDLPSEARGQELSADDMERFGARLVEFRVFRVEEGRER
jgi:CRISPR-associated protein Csx16